MGFLQRAAQIWREFSTDGMPSSGRHKPDKTSLRQWGLTVEAAIDAIDPDAIAAAISDAEAAAATATSKAAAAAASAASAGAVVATLAGTSASSFAIPSGATTISITASTGKAWIPGMSLLLTSASSPALWVRGLVGSYNASTGAMSLSIPAAAYGGSGTRSDWLITPVHPSISAEPPGSITESRALTELDSGRVLTVDMPALPFSTVGHVKVPANSAVPIAVGEMFEFVRRGGADVRFVPSAGVTISKPASGADIVGAFEATRLVKTGTNAWLLYGGGLGAAPADALAPAVWLDPSDLTSLKQEITGASATTAAVVNGAVGSVRNKGTVGGWFVAPATSRRPILRSDQGLYWLEFDGIDDYLYLAGPTGIDLTNVEMFCGARIIDWVSPQSGVVTLSPVAYDGSSTDYNVNTGIVPLYINGANYAVAARGGASTSFVPAHSGLMRTAHVFELRKVGATRVDFSVDNSAISDTTIPDTFGVHSGDILIGARSGNGAAGQFGNFALYGLIINTSLAADPATVRSYMADKSGTGVAYPSFASVGDVATARSTLISQVFSSVGGVVPSGTATLAVESPAPVTTLSNLAQCEKLTIPGYASRPRLWTPTGTPRSDVIALLCAGHDVGFSGNGMASVCIQSLLNAGVRCVTFVLPGGPDDKTSGDPVEHEAQKAPLSDWVGPVSIVINTLKASYPSAAIHMAGISGGGFMTQLCAAVDARISKSYQFVGSFPNFINVNRDWEQRLPGISATFQDLYILAACPGRRHKQILYENDPVGFNRATFNTQPTEWPGVLATQAASLGGGDYDLVWVDYNQHTFQSASWTAQFMAELP